MPALTAATANGGGGRGIVGETLAFEHNDKPARRSKRIAMIALLDSLAPLPATANRRRREGSGRTCETVQSQTRARHRPTTVSPLMISVPVVAFGRPILVSPPC